MGDYKVLLIGESCIDRFVYGECSRLNPEAPTPVFIPKTETTNGGMARNVLENLKTLGVNPTFVTNTKECIKTRYVDEQSNYILLRIDEDVEYTPLSIEECGDIEKYDVVVISDYDKGLITPNLVKEITKRAKLTFMDTKKTLSEWISGVNYIKLNKDEYTNNKNYVDNWLRLQTVVTLGGEGCMLNNEIMKGTKVEVRDVVGAGDTFLASLVVDFLRNGGKIYKAMDFANKCAADVVQHKGVVTPDLNNVDE